MLLDAEDEDGSRLSDQELRDQVMTLLFAGHDTATSTVTFLFYELARSPHEIAPLVEEVSASDDLVGGMPRLDMALDETLRMYPPAWIGPRRSIEPFELCGVQRARAGCSSTTARGRATTCPEVFAEPVALPAGALRAGGEGGAAEGRLRAVRRRIAHLHRDALRAARGEGDRGEHPAPLQARARVDPELRPSIRQMPTLSPRGGLPVVVRARA